MKKLLGQIICIFVVIGLTSCRQSTLTFNLQNLSKDNDSVVFKVTVAGKTIYNDKLRFNPDTSVFLTITEDVPIGKYVIDASADNGIVSATNPLMADLDQTIYISYSLNMQDTVKEKILHDGDSIMIARYANKKDGKINITMAMHK